MKCGRHEHLWTLALELTPGVPLWMKVDVFVLLKLAYIHFHFFDLDLCPNPNSCNSGSEQMCHSEDQGTGANVM